MDLKRFMSIGFPQVQCKKDQVNAIKECENGEAKTEKKIINPPKNGKIKTEKGTCAYAESGIRETLKS